ncbi:hypothetical protein BDQ17DRAFT_1335201 [Cyathus striatus]|nr:hypothetical protein BDQ17DRAFT_1335201 [Cyathus striatus]
MSQNTPPPQSTSGTSPTQGPDLHNVSYPYIASNSTPFVQNPYYPMLHIPLHHLQQSPGYSTTCTMTPNPLGDASSAILNSATVPSLSRKRKRTKQSTHGSKCLKNMASAPPSDSCGVGPSASNIEGSSTLGASSTSPLAATFDPEPTGPSLRPTLHRVSSATDVWYFLRPLDTDEVPSVWPNPDTESRLTEKPTNHHGKHGITVEVVV